MSKLMTAWVEVMPRLSASGLSSLEVQTARAGKLVGDQLGKNVMVGADSQVKRGLTVKASLDSTKFKSDVDRTVSDKVFKTITARLDDAVFKTALAKATGDQAMGIKANLDAKNAREQLAELSKDRTVRVNVDSSKVSSDGNSSGGMFGSAFASSAARSIAGGAIGSALAVSMASAIPAIAGFAAALAPAAGAIALLPAGILAAAAGITVLSSASAQVTSRLQAYDKAQASAAAGSAAMASAQAAAAKAVVAAQEQIKASLGSVKSAEETLDDARRASASSYTKSLQEVNQAVRSASDTRLSAARADLDATERVKSAEQTLSSVQQSARDAQLSLNDARQQAVIDLNDMRDASLDAALSSRDASLSEQEAKQRLNEVIADPRSTELQKQRAQLSVEQASARRKEAEEAAATAVKDAADAARRGVEGSEVVKTATKVLLDAKQRAVKAEKDVADARRVAAETAISGARSIADAEERVSAARRSATESALSGSRSITRAQDQLLTANDRLRKSYADLQSAQIPAGAGAGGAAAGAGVGSVITARLVELRALAQSFQTSVSDRFLTPLLGSLVLLAGSPTFGVIKSGFETIATSMGTAVASVADLLRTPDSLSKVSVIMDGISGATANLWAGLKPLASAFLTISAVGSSMLPGLTSGFGDLATKFDAFITGAAKSGELKKFMTDALVTIGQLAGLLGGLGSIIGSVFGAASSEGGGFLTVISTVVEKVDTFLKSAEGTEALGAVFGVLASVGKEIGSTLGVVLPLLGTALVALAPAMGPLFTALGGVVQALAPLLPIVGQIAGLIAGQLAGVISTLVPVIASLVAVLGPVLLNIFKQLLPPLGEIVKQIGPLLGASLKLVVPVLGVLATVVGTILLALAPFSNVVVILIAAFYAWSVVTKVMAAAQVLLNIAMSANPIGLVVIAIVALVAIIVVAYKNSETFRNVCKAALDVVKVAWAALCDGFVWYYENVIKPVWSGVQVVIGVAVKALKLWWAGLQIYLKALGAVFSWLYENIVRPAWTGIQLAVSVVVALLKVWWAGLQVALKALGAVFKWLYENIVRPMWTGIQLAVSVVVALLKVWWGALQIELKVLGSVFSWLYEKIVKPVWAGIQVAIRLVLDIIKANFETFKTGIRALATVFSWLYNNVIRPVWNQIKAVFDLLGGILIKYVVPAFKNGVTAIGKAWEAVKNLAKKPIEFIINTVINKGIIDTYKKVAGFFQVDHSKVTHVPLPKGWATGGPVNGPGTKHSDSMFARLSRGEHVLDADDVNNLGGHAGVYALRNQAAMHPTPRFAQGGSVGSGRFSPPPGHPRETSSEERNRQWSGQASAAAAVLKRMFPGMSIGTYVSGKSFSYHRGWAMDVMTNADGGAGQARGDAVVRWAQANAGKYGLAQILWNSRYSGGKGWTGLDGDPHTNHVHLSIGVGQGGGDGSGGGDDGGGGILDPVGYLMGLLKGSLKKTTSGLVDKFGMPGKIVVGMGGKVVDGIGEFAKNAFKNLNPFDGGSDDGKSDLTNLPGLSGWVRKAMSLTGVPHGWLNGLLTIISRESGGNVRAINNSDSNAAKGTPSKGLMQVIGPTFSAYHQAGTSNDIYDPVANIAAAINYIRARYGDISKVQQANPNMPHKGYSRGGAVYDEGGLLMPGQTLVNNRSGKPERVLSADQTERLSAALERLGRDRAGGATVNVGGVTVEQNADVDHLVSRLAFVTGTI